MPFAPEQLLSLLRRHPAARYVVAFSGGCDSTVLLHALATLRAELRVPLVAVHVDHGLQTNSERWSAHCAAVCASLDIPCRALRVNAGARPGESPEAAARAARYAALAGVMDAGDLLLIAHHRDDQAETLLLQLLRGAGPRGLAAMPQEAAFGKGRLLRPLLDFSRAALCAWARAQGLAWIDDPSNFDTGFDRNYLRRRVLPVLTERWPGAVDVIARSAVHQAEASLLLDELAAEDFAKARGVPSGTLSIEALETLPAPRRRNLIRFAVRQSRLPVPDAGRVERILHEVCGARGDASPHVSWAGGEARRYRDLLYLLRPVGPIPERPLVWDGTVPLAVTDSGVLTARKALGRGLRPDAGPFEVRFNVAGAHCRPAGGAHTRELRKLWQEAGVPPWERERTPMLFARGELAAVAGLCVCEPFTAAGDQLGTVPHWEPFAVEKGGENEDNLPGLAP